MTRMENPTHFSRRSFLKAGGALVVSLGAPIGFDTLLAVNAAFAAWTNVTTSSLVMESAGTATATANGFCDGTSTIVFNDPFGEVTDPSGCGGILAIGGYCAGGATKTHNGLAFREVVEGDLRHPDRRLQR